MEDSAQCLAKQLELRPFVLCLIGSVVMLTTLWKVASMTGRVRNQKRSLFLVHRNGTRVIERSAHMIYARKLSGLCSAAAEAEHALVAESFDRRMKSMQLFVTTQTDGFEMLGIVVTKPGILKLLTTTSVLLKYISSKFNSTVK